MRTHIAPPRLTPGSKVRIFGRCYIVGETTANGRIFTAADDGSEMMLSFGRQLEMMRREQLTTDARYSALSTDVLANLQRDWGSFSESQKLTATARHAFVRAIFDLPLAHRDKSAIVLPVLQSAADKEPGNLIEVPNFRTARDWYLRWVAAGCDVRALVPNLAARGDHEARYEPWIYEEINKAIDQTYASPFKNSVRQTLLRARTLIRIRAADERLALPGTSKEVIGRKVVESVLAKRGRWEILVKREGRAEAERLLRLTGAGPTGEYPLAEVEADHTPLDVMVMEGGVVLGRPWLTMLIDRFSQMVLGFSISFVPPSWVSVMEALRHAVLPKDEELQRWAEYDGEPFQFDWPCFGAPDVLIVDQGSEFLSASMAATEAALNMRLLQLPKASGDKKGTIEGQFHRLNRERMHSLNGTTFSNPQKRGKYKSQDDAIFSLNDVRYVVIRWVVDTHNRTPNSRTNKIPAELWREGMDEVGQKPAPPKELIAPLVGKVVSCKLRREGVRHKNLRWNSNAFRALRERIGRSSDVLIRIDPKDLRKAYVLDPDTHAWIEGDLMAERSIENMTLSQYEFLKERTDDARVVDEDYELKLARGSQAQFDFVEKRRRQNGVIPKPIAAFITEGSRAVEHIHGERHDPQASAQAVGTHNLDGPVLSPAPDPNGPYRDAVLRPVDPYPKRDETGRYPGDWQPPPPIALSAPAALPEPDVQPLPSPQTYVGRRRR
ncbi:DDE-type integrase/transposase/recombinase (plasmid) [Bosea sp. F3-2]|uniref:Mu transposase C-terminal domain-containing protein n=1 Tax=Bosea sp. F3-2 TaxID=2599640 RepID=UPI0011EEC317|nr:Mu transposase C-terminal domain-containing protein [Bosea sp. F3-2]QEL27280.1 DDE-type integrase/transposase/recombinase [Bosea sp. F3-2]